MSAMCSEMSGTQTTLRLSGPTMGTRWTAEFIAPPGADPGAIEAALAEECAMVDRAMSTWKPDSELMRLNRAPAGEWIALSAPLAEVIAAGLAVGRASGGRFDIALGDLVRAWGFSGDAPDEAAILSMAGQARKPAHERIELDAGGRRLRKLEPLAIDLCGIAKGYAVDRMIAALRAHGVTGGAAGLDGEVRAFGRRPDGAPWTFALEAPLIGQRAIHGFLDITDMAAATSGDYRNTVTVNGRHLSHSFDRACGFPAIGTAHSVTVLAPDCTTADAWATALMVAGRDAGPELARHVGLDAIFLLRGEDGAILEQVVGAP